MTKKAAALLLAASLAVSVCAMPVFAADATTPPNMGKQDGSNEPAKTSLTTDVLYEVTEGYTWSVPATINFGKDAGPKSQKRTVDANMESGDGTAAGATDGTAPKVMVTKNVIGTGKNLKINLKATGGFKVKNESNTELSYEVKTTAEKINGTPTTSYTEKNVDATNGTDILTLAAGKNTGEVDLKFTLTTTADTAETAGKYTGTVTFTSSID